MGLTRLPDDAGSALLPGFALFDVATRETSIRVRTGGSGPPLLLLHGYPQTHLMWHKVAARLADRFTLVMADLRGYGDSGRVATQPDHAQQSKRAMAGDMAEVMTALGHARFGVVGHDRGGRVAHRLCLDHEARVSGLVTLDIAPTREMYRHTSEAFARAYWHWFFLIRPAPLPERLIEADPDDYWRRKCGGGRAGLTPFDPLALAEYLRCFRQASVIHGSCEDYRAAATIDIAHDDADGDRRLAMPVLALWGAHGIVGDCFDVLGLWRQRATDVSGWGLPAGHYMAEETPDPVAEAVSQFFTGRAVPI